MEILDGVLIPPFEVIAGEILPVIPPSVADPEGTITPVWTHPAIAGTILDGEFVSMEPTVLLAGDPDTAVSVAEDGVLVSDSDLIQYGDPDTVVSVAEDGRVLEELYVKPDSETGIILPISDALRPVHLLVQYTSRKGAKSPWSVPVPYKVEKSVIEPI